MARSIGTPNHLPPSRVQRRKENAVISAWVPKREKREIQRRVRAEGTTLSAFLRDALSEHVGLLEALALAAGENAQLHRRIDRLTAEAARHPGDVNAAYTAGHEAGCRVMDAIARDARSLADRAVVALREETILRSAADKRAAGLEANLHRVATHGLEQQRVQMQLVAELTEAGTKIRALERDQPAVEELLLRVGEVMHLLHERADQPEEIADRFGALTLAWTKVRRDVRADAIERVVDVIVWAFAAYRPVLEAACAYVSVARAEADTPERPDLTAGARATAYGSLMDAGAGAPWGVSEWIREVLGYPSISELPWARARAADLELREVPTLALNALAGTE